MPTYTFELDIQTILTTLQRVEGKLDSLQAKETKDMASMQEATANLTAAVQRETDVQTSAITLIQGIAQQLRDAAGDPTAIQSLADQLQANANSLAQAVETNSV